MWISGLILGLLAAIVSLIAAIKPFRPYKTRKQAVLVAWGFLAVAFASGAQLDTKPVAQAPATANAVVQTAPMSPEEEKRRLAFCEYQQQYVSLIRKVDEQWGITPADGAQVGDVILTEVGAVIGREPNSPLGELYKIPPGQHLTVLNRLHKGERPGDVLYQVRWQEKGVNGFVDSASLGWMYSGEWVEKHREVREESIKELDKAARTRLFDDRGLDQDAVMREAIAGSWVC